MSARRIAGIAARVARRVLLGTAEHKSFDVIGTSTPLLATPQIAALSAVPQGDDYNQRTGSSIRAESLFIRYSIILNTTGGATQQVVRWWVIIDTGCQGATPSVSGTANSFLTGLTTEDMRNPLNTSRFLVLRQMTSVVSTGGSQRRIGQLEIPLRARLHYLGTGSTAADLGPNNIFLIALGSDAANGPTLSIRTRLRFIDA